MEFNVIFPENSTASHKVDVAFNNFVVKTDQPASYGGENSAPAPFQLFLASLATCSGWFMLRFLETRSLPLDGIELSLVTQTDPETKKLAEIRMVLKLPDAFPAKYRRPIVAAVHQCSVMRTMMQLPRFVTDVSVDNEIVLTQTH